MLKPMKVHCTLARPWHTGWQPMRYAIASPSTGATRSKRRCLPWEQEKLFTMGAREAVYHGSKRRCSVWSGRRCSVWSGRRCLVWEREDAKMAETNPQHASVPALPAASIIRSMCSGLSDEFPQQRKTNSPEVTLVLVSITASSAPPSSPRIPQGQHHRPARSPQTTEELPEEPVHHTDPWSRPHAGIVPGLSHPTDAVDRVHTP